MEVYGHRGMGCSSSLQFSLYPENSLTSFQKCLESGGVGIEFDVFLTDFNEIVVCHGESPGGLAFLNLLKYENGQLSLFPRDLSVENLNLSHKNVVLKAPWTYKDFKTNDDMCHAVSSLTESEKKDLYEEYVNSTVGYKLEDTQEYEFLPTLTEVFEKFGNKLKYNVELKGTKVQLTHEVIKVLKMFPNLDVMVSSFQWFPPRLSLSVSDNFRTKEYQDHENQMQEQLLRDPQPDTVARGSNVLSVQANKLYYEMQLNKDRQVAKDLNIVKDPNHSETDLLEPLLSQNLNFKIGLLFPLNDSLPTVDRIVDMARKYRANYVNLPDLFWLKKKPILGLDLKGEESLKYLVKRMHENNLKVLVWSVSPFDCQKYYSHYLDANVDIMCVNTVTELVNFHKKLQSQN